MSLLDMDERLVELAAVMDVVYSPLVDTKTFPEQVDLTLVEGSVSVERDAVTIPGGDRQFRQFPIAIPGIGQRRA